MIRMFRNIFICFVLMAVSLTVVWFAPGTYPHDLAAMVNKKEMLKTRPSPRMIFVGGSSVLSINGPLIEKELKHSVINMSLWGGMGTQEHLDEIRPFLRAGDVVVITMEYGTLLDPRYYYYIHTNEEAKKFFFLMSPERHIPEYFRKGNYAEMLKIMHELSQMKVKSYLRNIATFNFSHLCDKGFPNYHIEFDANGDRANPYMVFRPLGDRDTSFTYPHEKQIFFLNDFNDFASARKARVFFYFSPFPDKYYLINEKYINAYYEIMKKNFKGTLINKPSDFMYPEEYFADTIYHLNAKGENIRTPEMITMLKRAL
ncbi:MAG: hypothetical protein JW807_01295 [Spirochaetes bacterium]|nr:hypothetical protein [Spirochaetota bacterium]